MTSVNTFLVSFWSQSQVLSLFSHIHVHSGPIWCKILINDKSQHALGCGYPLIDKWLCAIHDSNFDLFTFSCFMTVNCHILVVSDVFFRHTVQVLIRVFMRSSRWHHSGYVHFFHTVHGNNSSSMDVKITSSQIQRAPSTSVQTGAVWTLNKNISAAASSLFIEGLDVMSRGLLKKKKTMSTLYFSYVSSEIRLSYRNQPLWTII